MTSILDDRTSDGPKALETENVPQNASYADWRASVAVI